MRSLLVALLFLSSCGFPDYVYTGPTIEGPVIEEGIVRAEAISGFEFYRRDSLVVGTEVSKHCPEWAMACTHSPDLIFVSEEYPVAAQICHEVLHILALDHRDIWDSYHNLFDYNACNI